jgi:hypothetical protein
MIYGKIYLLIYGKFVTYDYLVGLWC